MEPNSKMNMKSRRRHSVCVSRTSKLSIPENGYQPLQLNQTQRQPGGRSRSNSCDNIMALFPGAFTSPVGMNLDTSRGDKKKTHDFLNHDTLLHGSTHSNHAANDTRMHSDSDSEAAAAAAAATPHMKFHHGVAAAPAAEASEPESQFKLNSWLFNDLKRNAMQIISLSTVVLVSATVAYVVKHHCADYGHGVWLLAAAAYAMLFAVIWRDMIPFLRWIGIMSESARASMAQWLPLTLMHFGPLRNAHRGEFEMAPYVGRSLGAANTAHDSSICGPRDIIAPPRCSIEVDEKTDSTSMLDCTASAVSSEPHSPVHVAFVADIGDGYMSTHAVACGIASIPPQCTHNHSADRCSTVIMGGDMVYPYPTPSELELRVYTPYRDAAASIPGDVKHRDLVLCVGNHDCHDNRQTFHLFQSRLWRTTSRSESWRSDLKFRCAQDGTFMRKMIGNVQFFILDGAISGEIDLSQRRYFERFLVDQDHNILNTDVIVVIHQPFWLVEGDRPNVTSLIDRLIANGQLRAVIAGDIHCYRRCLVSSSSTAPTLATAAAAATTSVNGEPPVPCIPFVVAGGGGAFAHLPHNYQTAHAQSLCSQESNVVTFPDLKTSRSLVSILSLHLWKSTVSAAAQVAVSVFAVLVLMLLCTFAFAWWILGAHSDTVRTIHESFQSGLYTCTTLPTTAMTAFAIFAIATLLIVFIPGRCIHGKRDFIPALMQIQDWKSFLHIVVEHDHVVIHAIGTNSVSKPEWQVVDCIRVELTGHNK
jgi:Calcineurin-like phosphoesterase